MPINYMTPLDSLRSIPNSGFSSPQRRRVPGMGESIPGSLAADNEFQPLDETQLLGLQQQRQSELEDPRFADRPDVAGLKRSLAGDIQENPLTKQAADVESYMGKRGAAIEKGFGGTNPVAEQAGYGRQQEERKLGMPLEVAKANAAGDLAKQQEVSRGALGVAKEKSSQAENMWDMLAKARAGGADIRGVNVAGSGGVSFGAPPKPPTMPPGATHDLMLARQAATGVEPTQSGVGAWWGGTSGQPTKEHAALQQAIQNTLLRHPAPPELKEFAQKVSSHPETAKLSLEEILTATGETGLTPEEKGTLQELLGIVRGF